MARGKKGNSGASSRGQRNLRDSFVPSTVNGIRSGSSRHEGSATGSHHGQLLRRWFQAWANIISVGFNKSHLSLLDEARNTDRQCLWNTDVKLRQREVSFVSAGNLHERRAEESCRTPRKDAVFMEDHASSSSLHAERAFAGMNLQEDEGVSHGGGSNSRSKIIGLDLGNETTQKATSSPATSENGFIVDTIGFGTTFRTGLLPPMIRSPSPSSSLSECNDEVIVFAGRKQVRIRDEPLNTPDAGDIKARNHDSVRGLNHPIENGSNENTPYMIGRSAPHCSHENSSPLASAPPRNGQIPEHQTGERDISIGVATHHESDKPKTKQKRKKSKRKTTMKTKMKMAMQVDEEILADYIANMSNNSSNVSPAGTPVDGENPAGTETVGWRDRTIGLSPKRPPIHTSGMDSNWNPSEIEDLGNLSTSDEVLGSVQAVLSRRERSSGLQYLVVWEGFTMDDARWVPYASLRGASISEHIRLFEEKEEPLQQYSVNAGDTIDLSDEYCIDESETDDGAEAYKDEEDLLRRRISRMTDEKIARLLAKQEELGMGSDDVILFDDGDVDEEDDSDVMEPKKNTAVNRVLPPSLSRVLGSKRSNRDNSRALASVDLPDQQIFNDFDITDRERPSVQKRPKGRRGLQAFEQSDSELELSLSTAWDNDRTRKKLKKQEREELRAQGLLGKKNKTKPDLKAKYAEGMTKDEVKHEIRDFLLSTSNRYSNRVDDLKLTDLC